ncbi:AraC family transcriptional regulator [Mucilaginibacter sp. UR6-1]|uniref:AraC family transcriptional regulator n=1 Tax=Mucilaginibacter sp. UR6-1 TaxID=1435643 RepID=UPI001E3B184C|nr:AraC family transcriptional regulator [Mucilaginibacter sp. UR6-1]
MSSTRINTYDPLAFTSRFMPVEEMKALAGNFFVLPVEDMYKHLARPVPAIRATSHSLLYITEGEANMGVGNNNYTIGTNQMLVVAAGQVFSFAPGDINKGYICNFNDSLLTGKFGSAELLHSFEFLKIWGNPLIKPDAETGRYIYQLFKRLVAEYSKNKLSNIDVLQPYLLSLLTEINRAYTPLLTQGNTRPNSLVNKFKELVFTYFRTHKLVTDYAAMLHISANHLNKIIRNATQKSPSVWIDEAIIAEARVLLIQTTLSISEIAHSIGLDDPSYFTRLFKRYEGVTPSAYRAIDKC